MFKETLQSLAGVEIFPIISLILFIVMFTIVVIWAIKIDKTVISEMENIPLKSDLNNGDRTDV